jgi:hypothetical protein
MPRVLTVGFLLVLGPAAGAQTPKPSLPDPVRFVVKYDIAWNVVRSVLTDAGFAIELEDRKGGRLVTKPQEYIAGSLTSSEVDKVGIKNNTVSGSWLRAQYAVEALVEIVSPTVTLVTIRTRMEALNRDLDGSEKWMPVESLGVLEKRILGKISIKIVGNEMTFEKKGFWSKKPEPVSPSKPKPFPTPPPQF